MSRPVHRLHPGRSADALRLWGLMAVLATVLQLNEPLLNATVSQHLFYWGVRFSAFFIALFGAQWLTDTLWPGRFSSPRFLKPVILVSVLAIVPFTLVELWLESQMPMIPEYDDDELMSISPLLAYAAEFATNATIIVPIHFLVWLLVDRHAHATTEPTEPTQSASLAEPEFLLKTRGITLGNLQAIKAEEHYVQIYSAEGSELIHHKFGAAIKALPEHLGLQVHRSWWVADQHVTDARRGARRWQLITTSGIEVPVSDGYVKAVRARGLLKRKSGRLD